MVFVFIYGYNAGWFDNLQNNGIMLLNRRDDIIAFMKKIALLMDNPQRDMAGIALLAWEFAQRGQVCYIIPWNLHVPEIWTLAPDFVLFNYLRKNNEMQVRQCMGSGIKVGVLETEGGVLASMDAYTQTMTPDTSVRHGISCFCSWGPGFAEYAARQGWYRKEQISVTGSPRYDFYVQPWRDVALTTSDYAEVCPLPMILINSNFPVINPRFQTPEKEVKSMYKNWGFDRELAMEWQRVQKETMMGMVEVANRLAARFPDVSIVYRPHPFERLETYHELLDGRDNLYLSNSGTVDGWVLRSTAVIQRSCSTAIEAGVVGVPALSPYWIPTAVDMPTVEAVSVACESQEEMEARVEDLLEGRYQTPTEISRKLGEIIDEWFYRIDGEAHERVASVVMQQLDGTDGGVDNVDNKAIVKKCRDLAYGWRIRKGPRFYLTGATSILRKSLGLPMGWSFRRWRNVGVERPWKEGKRYTVEQVRAIVDAVHERAQAQTDRPLHRVGVQASQERGDYHFGYLNGRSVTVFPE